MKETLLAFATLCFLALTGLSQDKPNTDDFQGLYHMKDPSELLRMHEVGRSFQPSQAPVGPVRNIAEFHRMEGVLIAWDYGFGIPYSLIAEMSQDCKVYTIIPSATYQASIVSSYQSNGVNLNQCEFIVAPLNSYWTRDYGPWFIMDGNGEVGIVDFPYNRPRPNDDAIPGYVASAMGLNTYNMNLIHTGGNYMTDGMGIAASSNLVQSENPSLSLTQIQQLVQDYLGIQSYHLHPDPLGLYIQHIDCWAKFLDVDKILITEVPQSDPRYADFEAIASWYAMQNSSYGTPYQVFRVYSPNGQPYTNSLILNHKVLVPLASGAGSVWNDSALARYQQAMPGYEIIGVPSGSASWQTTDALHCRTKGLADREMLSLWHIPLSGLVAPAPLIDLSFKAVSAGAHPLIADSMFILHRVNQGMWDTLLLTQDTAGWWRTALTGLLPGDVVEYFMHASDTSGRTETHPFIGEADPHRFTLSLSTGPDDDASPVPAFHLWPNPADDISFLLLPQQGQGSLQISVFDITGKLVYTEIIAQPKEEGSLLTLDTRTWAPSVYVVTVTGEGIRSSKRLLVR